MSVVIAFDRYHTRRRHVPPLVFVSMLERQLEPGPGFGSEQVAPVLARCRLLLEKARADAWPVAFVNPHKNGRTKRYRWIDGFAPQRHDMVFEGCGPSCYTCPEFADTMTSWGNVFVVAGFWGEGACLMTLMEAPRYGHTAGFICDASATRPLPDCDADTSHRAVTAVAGRYATIVTAERWVDLAGSRQSELEPDHGAMFH